MLKKKLIELRAKKNWTQTQLAQISGISQPLIAGYENGKNASKRTVQKLADVFGVSLEELLPEKEIEAIAFDEVEYTKLISQSKKFPTEYKRVLSEIITVFKRELELTSETEKLAQILSKQISKSK